MARFANHTHHHRSHHQPVNNDPAASPTTALAPADSPSTDAAPVSPETSTPVAGDAPALSSLGADFNDATRALVGGLWQNVVEEGGQGHGSIIKYTDDLTAVKTGLTAELNAGQFSGDALNHVQTILSDITTALSAATASVSDGGTFGSVAAAEAALRTSHLDVLDLINNDPVLAAAATQNGAAGFSAAPATLPDGATASNTPHANLAEIGAIFNDAASRILGGVNADNAGVITDDVNAVMTDMQALMKSNPTLFGGLTRVHADTIVRQLELEKTYINQAGVSQDAGRASNDNILDIIESCRATPTLPTWQRREASPASRLSRTR